MSMRFSKSQCRGLVVLPGGPSPGEPSPSGLPTNVGCCKPKRRGLR